MIVMTNKMDAYRSFTLDNNTGELMLVPTIHGAFYGDPFTPDWDELDETTFNYYVDRHMYLLSETMPDKYDDFYPAVQYVA